MSNVMAVLPNIVCSTPQSSADAHYLTAVVVLWGHVGEILLLKKFFFFRLSIGALVAKI